MARASGTAPWPVAQLTVDEYHRLAEIGVVQPDDRLELLEGWLVPKVTNSPPHAAAVQRLTRLFTLALVGSPWEVRCQLPVTLARSEPEPDIALVAAGLPAHRHPYPAELAAVIEVAHSSITADRRVKARIYAAEGIEPYVIVNLAEAQLELLTDPRPGGVASYARHAVLKDGILDLAGRSFAVPKLLG